MKYVKILIAFTAVYSLFGVEVQQTLIPLDRIFTEVVYHYQYDKKSDQWVNDKPVFDAWMVQLSKKEYLEITGRAPLPAKKHYKVFVTLKKTRKPELTFMQAMMVGQLPFKRRLILINVEQSKDYEGQYKIYPHLGILYVGTVAHQEGWDVTLWDELIQSHCDLEKLVKPGDVVGLSLVITGMERGVTLARQAKQLGASCVMAGNDSAIFRSDQLLKLPGKPIDVVFTSNSLNSIRAFFRQFDGANLSQLRIPEMATRTGGMYHSNRHDQLLIELQDRKTLRANNQFDNEDGFLIPNFSLYPIEYWKQAWANYRAEYGHKHVDSNTVRNAIGLLAQGCTRTQGTDACTYCTIYGVGDIRVPSEEYLAATLEAYQDFGITGFFNVTDSAYEMVPLLHKLENLNAQFEALTIYGRAQGLAMQPKNLERWLNLVNSRLLINTGMDSGDERMLSGGILKSSVMGKGSRLEENRQAVRIIRDSNAHLHYSLIFGSPGESRDSCERTLEFIQWSADMLGQKLDLVETDLYWLNFGAPASQLFTDYTYAQKLAAIAGKTITHEQWQRDFSSHSEDLIVSWETERNWYRYFTQIDLDTAQEYNQRATAIMARHSGAIGGRAFNPLKEG